MSEAMKGYITVSQYAARHDITRVAVYKRIKTGKIKSVRVGYIWLVKDDKSK